MIYTVDKIISYISRFYTLKMGDILFTGTLPVWERRYKRSPARVLRTPKLLDFRVK